MGVLYDKDMNIDSNKVIYGKPNTLGGVIQVSSNSSENTMAFILKDINAGRNNCNSAWV